MGILKNGNKLLNFNNKILNNFKYKIFFNYNRTINSNNLKAI